MHAAAPEHDDDRYRRRIAELEARVAQLEVTLDSAPYLISYVSPDQRYCRVNKAYEDVFGLRCEEILGRTVAELTGEPHYSKARSQMARALAGERVTFQSRLPHRDGTLHDMDVTYAPDIDGEGEVKGVVICVRDTTEEHRAWAEARKRERDLLSVMRNVPDVISRYDRDFRFVFTSAAVERHTGLPPSHFAGKSHAELGFPPELCTLLEDGLREIFATRLPKTVRFDFPGPNGPCHFEAVGAPEFDEDGNVVSVLTITHDIAQRLQAEQELRRSEERQRLAVEAGKVGLWHWDIEKNHVEWSDLIYEIHGLSKEEFGGTVEDFAARIHPEDRELVSDELSKAMAGQADYHVEFRTVRPDETVRWIYANGKVVYEGVRPLHMLGAVLDVTESKSVQEALARANEELRRANEDLNQFAYSASHDLKEPLRMIALYTQLLRRKYSEHLDGDGHRYLGYAVDGAKRMDNLLRDLLAYTEAITAGNEAPAHSVSLDRALDNVQANLTAMIEETGAVITSDRLPIVRWSETHGVQVLQNLIVNAIKYRSPNRPPRIHISCEKHLRSWQISVADNGIGVDARYHERIFGIFKRLHSSEKYEGTGIGLAICQKIVERNGGRIWIESEPANGSTFYFTCPIA